MILIRSMRKRMHDFFIYRPFRRDHFAEMITEALRGDKR